MYLWSKCLKHLSHKPFIPSPMHTILSSNYMYARKKKHIVNCLCDITSPSTVVLRCEYYAPLRNSFQTNCCPVVFWTVIGQFAKKLHTNPSKTLAQTSVQFHSNWAITVEWVPLFTFLVMTRRPSFSTTLTSQFIRKYVVTVISRRFLKNHLHDGKSNENNGKGALQRQVGLHCETLRP